MAMENYTRYQQSIIRNHYKNQDNVSLQRAQELLTDLYLTEGKKKEKVWDSLFNHLEKIGLPADQIAHLKEAKNPETVADFASSSGHRSVTALPAESPMTLSL